MANLTLWEQLAAAKANYKWVDLTHELSPETPHWYGFNPLQADLLFDYVEGTPEDMMAPMRCFQYSVASQYGTHVDVPRHFWGNGRPMNEIEVKELVYPLVVIDKSAECAANPDFMLKIEDIQAWEAEYGKIPEGAFVALRTDWSKGWPCMDKLSGIAEDGSENFPGWSLPALQYIYEVRKAAANGHETLDTDASAEAAKACDLACHDASMHNISLNNSFSKSAKSQIF